MGESASPFQGLPCSIGKQGPLSISYSCASDRLSSVCRWTPSWQPSGLISLERLQRRRGAAVREAEDRARIILPVNHVRAGFSEGEQKQALEKLDATHDECFKALLYPTLYGFTSLAAAAAGSLVAGQKKDRSVHPDLQALRPALGFMEFCRKGRRKNVVRKVNGVT